MKTTSEIIDLWLFLVGIAWIIRLNDPAYGAAIMLCDWVMHIRDLNI
jgi:hypothetical protein